MGPKCFSKKCGKFPNFISNNYICVPGLSNRKVLVQHPCIYEVKLLRNYTLDIPTLLAITSMENKFSTEKIKQIFWPTAISSHFCSWSKLLHTLSKQPLRYDSLQANNCCNVLYHHSCNITTTTITTTTNFTFILTY